MCYRLSCGSRGFYSSLFFFKWFYVYIYFWLCWVFVAAGFSPVSVSRVCSSCGVQASYYGGFSCCTHASVVEARGLNSCGAWTQLLHGKWDRPRPGIEPMSPALQSGLNHWTTGEALIPHSFPSSQRDVVDLSS